MLIFSLIPGGLPCGVVVENGITSSVDPYGLSGWKLRCHQPPPMPTGTPYNGHIPPYNNIRIDAFTSPRNAGSVNYKSPDLLLLTHTHSDHVHGLASKSFGLPLYCSADARVSTSPSNNQRSSPVVLRLCCYGTSPSKNVESIPNLALMAAGYMLIWSLLSWLETARRDLRESFS